MSSSVPTTSDDSIQQPNGVRVAPLQHPAGRSWRPRSQRPAPELAGLQVDSAVSYPAPEVLERYERLYPGVTKRLFDLAERQARHRQDLERVAAREEHQRALLGMVAGAVISVVVIGIGGWVALDTNAAAGGAIIGIDLAGLTVICLLGAGTRTPVEPESQRA